MVSRSLPFPVILHTDITHSDPPASDIDQAEETRGGFGPEHSGIVDEEISYSGSSGICPPAELEQH